MNDLNDSAQPDVARDDLAADGSILAYAPEFDDFENVTVAEPFHSYAEPLPCEEPLSGLEGLNAAAFGLNLVAASSVSGGIAKPNNVREDWMNRYDGVRSLRIQDCILPGTHNSASDKEAKRAPSNETCQDVSPLKQLRAGIRVLDLRVQFYAGYPANDPRRFSIFHQGNSGRTVRDDILGGLAHFRSTPGFNTSREMVILDFHEFKGFNKAAHLELAKLIKGSVGVERLVTPSMATMTIGQIWSKGPANTVIAYNSGERDSSFWSGVNQRWIGSNTPTDNALRDFIAAVGREKKGATELKAVQAAKYALPGFVPNDKSDKLMTWFASGEGKPILNHYIINTDWSLRQRLVDNCIHGNFLRGRSIRY
ncbi:hypothetical protein [Pseudomonas sp.]|uniref:hypothetical protein n=1 Tax=Pseudomonas sp. TaxID=306 RepID=UPI003CC5D82D